MRRNKLIDMGVIDEAVGSGRTRQLEKFLCRHGVGAAALKHPDCHALVTRQVGDTMRDSCMRKSCGPSTSWGLPQNSNAHKAHCSVPTQPPGSAFCSVDWMIRRKSNPSSCRSVTSASCGLRKPIKSKGGEDAVRNVQQSRCAAVSLALPFISFNPPAASRNWQTATPARNAKGKRIHHSTYLQAPPAAWLGPKFLAQAEYIKETQPTKYRHEYLGEVIGSGTQVFENLRLEPISQKTIRNFDTIENGVDWGWYPRPVGRSTAATMMRHAKRCISSDELTGCVHLQRGNRKAGAAAY